MRGTLLASLFTLGVLAMSDATAEPQKKDEKEPRLNTTVTFRRWVEKTGAFDPNPAKNVKARKREIDGKPAWDLTDALVGGKPTLKSEITDADGKVWVVEKVTAGSPHVCYVREKPAEKKPE